MNKIKILVVRPNKQPYIKEINNTINEVYGLVYYPYNEIEIQKNIFLIYSKDVIEDEKMFEKNRMIKDIQIYGNFVVVSKIKDSFISLTNEQIKDVLNLINERK